jgi:hypothetical protein
LVSRAASLVVCIGQREKNYYDGNPRRANRVLEDKKPEGRFGKGRG